jgi:hypothetical protein
MMGMGETGAMMTQPRTHKRALVICGGVVVFGMLLYQVAFPSKWLQTKARPHLDRVFEKDGWMGGRRWIVGRQLNPRYGVRYEMVDDLLRSRRLQGKSESECLLMLERPEFILDKEFILKNPYSAGRTSIERDIIESPVARAYWSYSLGSPEQFPPRGAAFMGWGMSDDWCLVIEMRDGRVVAARVQ